METKLQDSGVIFIEENHTYHLNGKELQGITSTLIPAIFGDYTKSIPEGILARAAERGTYIHQQIELIDEWDAEPSTDEAKAYVRLRDGLGLKPVASEYIVTDGVNFASPIDKVYEGHIIADIKTTSEIHYPELRFQLSWYAAYYEEANDEPIKEAYVVWLPKEQYGEARMERVELVSADVVHEIEMKYLAGEDVTSYASVFGAQLSAPTEAIDLPVSVQETVMSITNLENEIKALESNLKTMKAQRDEFIKPMTEFMVVSGQKKIVFGDVTLTYIEPTVRVSIDSKALKADHPDMYEQYKRETAVRETVRINIKAK